MCIILVYSRSIDVRHFSPGQFVNVCGITQGKGFQGGMKRHGFSGQGEEDAYDYNASCVVFAAYACAMP